MSCWHFVSSLFLQRVTQVTVYPQRHLDLLLTSKSLKENKVRTIRALWTFVLGIILCWNMKFNVDVSRAMYDKPKIFLLLEDWSNSKIMIERTKNNWTSKLQLKESLRCEVETTSQHLGIWKWALKRLESVALKLREEETLRRYL
jgi:hypothetical protein